MFFAEGTLPLHGSVDLAADGGSDLNPVNVAVSVGITIVIQALVVLVIVVLITVRRSKRRRAMNALRKGKHHQYLYCCNYLK